MTALRLFYQEPDPDRWLPGDHVPRAWIRRLVRGPRRPGGQEIVFLNLCAGLRETGVPFVANDFAAARRDPAAPVGIVGKTHLLDHHTWRNPILFGASVASHPFACPDLPDLHPIRRVLVPGDWMRDMFAAHWGPLVHSWPVGVDTVRWQPRPGATPDIDVLVYDKIRWRHDHFKTELLAPLETKLREAGRSTITLRYGHYREEDFEALLPRVRCMLFLCEHETQGLAYQQCLAAGVPIMAWDRGGPWQDPEYYPDRVKFGPVSSVPYWDARCGHRFEDAAAGVAGWDAFWAAVESGEFRPRDYILEKLTLAQAARAYLRHWDECFGTSLASVG